MHATIFSGSISGVEGLRVEVEVDISRGIPSLSIVGLPNTAVRESRERVTAAIKNAGWEFPLERITVNLAPADIRKEGAAFDLAIAVGILAASSQLDPAVPPPGHRNGEGSGDAAFGRPHGKRRQREPLDPGICEVLRRTIFLGELALNSGLRRVRGVLPVLLHARKAGFERAVVPAENFCECLVIEGMEVFGCRRLEDAVWILVDQDRIRAAIGDPGCARRKGVLRKARDEIRRTSSVPAGWHGGLDMREVLGQESVKRALTIAAAGGHHVLMVGPPGAGKTMLARRFPSILPPLDDQAALETTMIYSTAGVLDGNGLITLSPFRAPHHSVSDAGLIGGGSVPRPGEVTLAHNGVLFLDELTEFKRHVLEALREPLEEGRITISRARHAVTFPARFQLIAATNPCPCGYLGSREERCRCSPLQVERYLAKLSGPLLDRISIHLFVRPVEISAFRQAEAAGGSQPMQDAVSEARKIQRCRANGLAKPPWNARLPESCFKAFCAMEPSAEELLFRAQKQLRISARGRNHVIRVARTIADLEGVERIKAHHVAEAVQYRIRELPV